MNMRNPCSAAGCTTLVVARGLCRHHYSQRKYLGTLNETPLIARPTVVDRFFDKVTITDYCWEWTSVKNRFGHGRLWVNGRFESAHRVCHVLFIGPIPEGLVVDHLCGNPSCVNPGHLEAVTQRENLLRANTFQAANAAKTHCVSGHEFTPTNTLRDTEGNRVCRKCRQEESARTYLRRKARLADASS